jgi:hypothetical protein
MGQSHYPGSDPPPPLQQGHTPHRTPRKGLGAGAIVAIVGVALALLCSGVTVVAIATAMQPAPDPGWAVPGSSESARPMAGARSTQLQGFTVVLEVSGTKTADVSWNINGTGGQDLGVALPWTKTLGPFDGFVIASMLAQSKDNTTSAAVRGKLTVAGKAIECTGQGPYSVATCTQNS